MKDDFSLKIDELRLEAETLIKQVHDPLNDVSADKTGSLDYPESALATTGESLEDTAKDLEIALNQLSKLTSEKIAQHPVATAALAFALGLLLGRLTKSQE